MPKTATHRVALVTGSGPPRVGNAIARTLSARGYHVAVHANRSLRQAQSTAEELTTAGHEAIAVTADLTQEQAVIDMVARVRERFGRIDALVNAAAIYDAATLENTTANDVRHQFETNTLATFLCCQHVGLAMVAQSAGGAIVNIGDWAIARPYADYAAYLTSKGAIPTLTRTFAVELARRNPRVRVNAILPGPVLFPPGMPEAERRAAVAATLVKREGRPQHVADAAVLLLENEFITGVCLPVDGGRSICSE
ncbi:MAG: SDR family oxidoreductase [Planctomycetia bacterium]|nr:SDR family oxidoreductase [Planctomycetia bacterium]